MCNNYVESIQGNNGSRNSIKGEFSIFFTALTIKRKQKMNLTTIIVVKFILCFFFFRCCCCCCFQHTVFASLCSSLLQSTYGFLLWTCFLNWVSLMPCNFPTICFQSPARSSPSASPWHNRQTHYSGAWWGMLPTKQQLGKHWLPGQSNPHSKGKCCSWNLGFILKL